MKILAIGALLGFATAINLNVHEQANNKQLHRLGNRQNHQFLSFIFGKKQESAASKAASVKSEAKSEAESEASKKASQAESAQSDAASQAASKASDAEDENSDALSNAKSAASDAQSAAESAASDAASEEESAQSAVESVQEQTSFVSFQLPPAKKTSHLRKHKLTNDNEIAHKKNKEHQFLFGHSSTTSSSSTSAQEIRRKKWQKENGVSPQNQKKGWFS